jgi:hypothetical protein
MKITRLSVATALAFTLGTLAQAHADQVPGKQGNCAATWDTGTAAATVGLKSSTLTCQDGDATCDTDRLPNGVCTIAINACVGQITETCPAPAALTSTLKFSAQITNKQIISGFVPPGPPPSCGTAGTLLVPLKRVPKKQTKPLKKYNPSKKVVLLMKAKKFKNKLVVQCVPPTTGVCALRTDNPSFPAQLTLTTPATGSDLDNGWTGSSHNFPIQNGSTLKYCLSNCDGTSDTLCDGTGTTGDNSLNGPQFGAPLPLLAANVPVCVINRHQTSPITNIYDVATGRGTGDVNLFSDVYLTNSSEVCPRCNPTGTAAIGGQGKCTQTAGTPGASCTITGAVKVAQGAGDQQYYLSGSCIPAGNPTATLDIRLPLTTGEAPALTGPLPCRDTAGPQLQSDDCDTGTCTEGACTGAACISGAGANCVDVKGGISQACCSNKTTTPCFTSKTAPITRVGKPATSGNTGSFAATFCIARTNSNLINTVTGLPGPGAMILPTAVVVTP